MRRYEKMGCVILSLFLLTVWVDYMYEKWQRSGLFLVVVDSAFCEMRESNPSGLSRRNAASGNSNRLVPFAGLMIAWAGMWLSFDKGYRNGWMQ